MPSVYERVTGHRTNGGTYTLADWQMDLLRASLQIGLKPDRKEGQTGGQTGAYK